MGTCKESRRNLPYAVHLTAVFKKMNISLENENFKEIPKVNVYNMDFIKKFMKLKSASVSQVEGQAEKVVPTVTESQLQTKAEQVEKKQLQPDVQGITTEQLLQPQDAGQSK